METETDFEMVARINKDLKEGAKLLGKKAVRYLVDYYYTVQNSRIRAGNQVRMASKDAEPNIMLSWTLKQHEIWEKNVHSALNIFTKEYRIGRWLQSIIGIGPVISAGLMSHLDITIANTTSRFLRFCGLDPTIVWNKGERRPYSAFMRSLTAFKMGECFVKFQNHKDDTYGKIYVERKKRESDRNLSGHNADDALIQLAKFDIGKDTEAYKWYSGCLTPHDALTILVYTPAEQRQGMATKLAKEPLFTKDECKNLLNVDPTQRLSVVREMAKKRGDGQQLPMLPPAHIHARARRFAVTIFLSHAHHAMYTDYYEKEPPVPYIFSKAPEHTHFIPLPNWPFTEGGKSLKQLQD